MQKNKIQFISVIFYLNLSRKYILFQASIFLFLQNFYQQIPLHRKTYRTIHADMKKIH